MPVGGGVSSSPPWNASQRTKARPPPATAFPTNTLLHRYKFFLFLLRRSLRRFLSLCLFILDRRFFRVLEHRASTPPNTPPNQLLLTLVNRPGGGGVPAAAAAAVGLLRAVVAVVVVGGKRAAEEVKPRVVVVVVVGACTDEARGVGRSCRRRSVLPACDDEGDAAARWGRLRLVVVVVVPATRRHKACQAVMFFVWSAVWWWARAPLVEESCAPWVCGWCAGKGGRCV